MHLDWYTVNAVESCHLMNQVACSSESVGQRFCSSQWQMLCWGLTLVCVLKQAFVVPNTQILITVQSSSTEDIPNDFGTI